MDIPEADCAGTLSLWYSFPDAPFMATSNAGEDASLLLGDGTISNLGD
jgi:hypothetical protein